MSYNLLASPATNKNACLHVLVSCFQKFLGCSCYRGKSGLRANVRKACSVSINSTVLKWAAINRVHWQDSLVLNEYNAWVSLLLSLGLKLYLLIKFWVGTGSDNVEPSLSHAALGSGCCWTSHDALSIPLHPFSLLLPWCALLHAIKFCLCFPVVCISSCLSMLFFSLRCFSPPASSGGL